MCMASSAAAVRAAQNIMPTRTCKGIAALQAPGRSARRGLRAPVMFVLSGTVATRTGPAARAHVLGAALLQRSHSPCSCLQRAGRTCEDVEVQALDSGAALSRLLRHGTSAQGVPRCHRPSVAPRKRQHTSKKWLAKSTCVPECADSPPSCDSLHMSPLALAWRSERKSPRPAGSANLTAPACRPTEISMTRGCPCVWAFYE